MAEPDDQNLDDFFAKKDKTKKKTAKTSSRFTTDDIETQMDKKLKKKSLAKKKEKDAANSSKSSVLDVKVKDDEEWKEVEVETEKDLSDLRIQNLKISGRDEEDKDRQDNTQSGDEGDERGGKDVPQGPWKSFAVAAPATSNVASTEKAAPPEPEKDIPKTSTSTGKYVPPGARRAQQSAPTVSSTGYGGRKSKIAPNVNSTDDFPSLAAAATDQGDVVGHDFEKVKSGGRLVEDPSNKQVKLSLGNKYGALDSVEGKEEES